MTVPSRDQIRANSDLHIKADGLQNERSSSLLKEFYSPILDPERAKVLNISLTFSKAKLLLFTIFLIQQKGQEKLYKLISFTGNNIFCQILKISCNFFTEYVDVCHVSGLRNSYYYQY